METSQTRDKFLRCSLLCEEKVEVGEVVLELTVRALGAQHRPLA